MFRLLALVLSDAFRSRASNERQLHRVVTSYAGYYNPARTHTSLDKDAPEGRSRSVGRKASIIAHPEVGGLHHRYERIAA
jgi:hypothetical protein